MVGDKSDLLFTSVLIYTNYGTTSALSEKLISALSDVEFTDGDLRLEYISKSITDAALYINEKRVFNLFWDVDKSS